MAWGVHEYVVRILGLGKSRALVRVAGDATFRLNEPADTWPEIALLSLPRWLTNEALAEFVARFTATATLDSTAFDIAARDACAALGLLTMHVDGNVAPDSILAAPFGVAG